MLNQHKAPQRDKNETIKVSFMRQKYRNYSEWMQKPNAGNHRIFNFPFQWILLDVYES